MGRGKVAGGGEGDDIGGGLRGRCKLGLGFLDKGINRN